MSRTRLRELLDSETARLACAFIEDQLIGYCVAVQADDPDHGAISWVSQLVVHTDYRGRGVATRLLYSVWQFSDRHAWGIVTANPFAIRALEMATRRPCRANRIVADGPELLARIEPYVPYLRGVQLVVDDKGRREPKLDTRFDIDHSEVNSLRRQAARQARPWSLRDIGPGEEWIACTFRDQEMFPISAEELHELLEGTDDIWIQAYEGMTLTAEHRWHAHASEEVDLATRLLGVRPGDRVLDVGCGDGRHTRLLAERGYQAVGVDISAGLIAEAVRTNGAANATFLQLDARRQLPEGPFHSAIALYDVIGSSANRDDDLVLLQHVRTRLRPGGLFVASVMNAGATAAQLKPERRPAEIGDFLSQLERLPPSSTMEMTGAVFDPELLLVYDDVHYRKEQFVGDATRLPAELIVRDRRFTSATVRILFESARFEVLEVRPVRSGRWAAQPPLAEHSQDAKELLVVARAKP